MASTRNHFYWQVAAICFATLIASAHGPDDERHPKTIPAIRVSSPPVIDGVLDDAVWREAPVAKKFHPSPNDPLTLPPFRRDAAMMTVGNDAELVGGFMDTSRDDLAELQTEVRIAYDDEFIYVAAVMYQNRDTINATERKYDRMQLRFEDYFQVMFDTFHDHQSTYVFLVSPLGVRWDSRDGVLERNVSWDAEWSVKTDIHDDRWIAEMAIPIGVMYHNRDDYVTWGINFRRRVSLQNASSHWNYTPNAGVPGRAQGPKFVADFGHWDGIDLSDSVIDKTPRIEQYVTSGVRRRPGSDDVHRVFRTGIDLEMRLDSHWVTTFAASPDFVEVAADEGDVENRDTQRFLEERRNFFKEGAEIFRTPINVYDSRSILDFEGAAKITGIGDNWTAATLSLRGEASLSGDEALMSVTRATLSPTPSVQLGTTFVGIDRRDGYNVVAGADARVDVGATSTWTSQYLYMIDEGRDDFETVAGEDAHQNEHGFLTVIEGGDRPWFYRLDFTDISEDFQPDLSFVPRRDIIGPTLLISYRDDYEHPIVEGARGEFFWEYYQNHDGKTVLRDYFLESTIEFQNGWDFTASFRDDFHDPFHNDTYLLGAVYNREDRYKSWEGFFSWGEFQKVDFAQFTGAKPFQLTRRWLNAVSGTFRQEEPRHADTRDVWLARFESEYTFDWDGRVKLAWEEGSDESHLRTLLFAYENVRNWDFYIVANDIRTFDDIGMEYEKLEFFTKFVYRWRPKGRS